jgi:predicted flap endonuclease-1-like 5' DNA nuclease
MTEAQIQILLTVLAYAFGLLSKILYDLWDERRRKKSLLFTKSVLASFSAGMLEEDLREQVEVRYQGRSIKSIQMVEVGVENNGHAVVKSQSFTVKFGEEAQILGQPESDSSPEDLRYVHRDQSVDASNQRRFVIDLLQKGRRVSWNFIVINQGNEDFSIHPGVADKNVEEVDFDVETAITKERARLNLADRIKRSVYILVGILTLAVLRGFFVRSSQEMIILIFNIVIISSSIWLADEITKTILPLMNWISDTFGGTGEPSYSDIDMGYAHYCIIGSGSSMSAVTAYDEDMQHTLAQYLMEDFPFHATNSSLMRPDSLLAIEGVGKTYGRLFREIGIEDRSDLLRSAVSAESRKELADATGISEQLISRWVRRADLMRIHGVGSQYAEILERAGVTSVADLRTRNPDSLHREMERVNLEENLVRRLPDPERIQEWIEKAKDLPELSID